MSNVKKKLYAFIFYFSMHDVGCQTVPSKVLNIKKNVNISVYMYIHLYKLIYNIVHENFFSLYIYTKYLYQQFKCIINKVI